MASVVFRVTLAVLVGIGLTAVPYPVFADLLAIIKVLTQGVRKSAPKHADELPGSKNLKPAPHDEGSGLIAPLIKPLPRSTHQKTCPAMSLRVSLPQLNVSVVFPTNVNIRHGPDKGSPIKNTVKKAGTYLVDMLRTKGCWIEIRYDGGNDTGWVYSELLSFEFDNHLTKPSASLTRKLGATGVYELAAKSTYIIHTTESQGLAVAISPTVLLTNCHVSGKHEIVHIAEGGKRHSARLIHDDYSRDKCFIRSLALQVRPVSNVQNYQSIKQGEQAYTIGAPLGLNRSIGEGIVSGKRDLERERIRFVQTTAPISPGSSGGGLFDDRGNLLGITTFTITPGQALNFAIAAEDFWR
jgi:uncharacterized protein YraI